MATSARSSIGVPPTHNGSSLKDYSAHCATRNAPQLATCGIRREGFAQAEHCGHLCGWVGHAPVYWAPTRLDDNSHPQGNSPVPRLRYEEDCAIQTSEICWLCTTYFLMTRPSSICQSSIGLILETLDCSSRMRACFFRPKTTLFLSVSATDWIRSNLHFTLSKRLSRVWRSASRSV